MKKTLIKLKVLLFIIIDRSERVPETETDKRTCVLPAERLTNSRY
jgi:hypothetical protein